VAYQFAKDYSARMLLGGGVESSQLGAIADQGVDLDDDNASLD
jgi:hypothetical protein